MAMSTASISANLVNARKAIEAAMSDVNKLSAAIRAQETIPAVEANKFSYYNQSAWPAYLRELGYGDFVDQGDGSYDIAVVANRVCTRLRINTSEKQSAAYIFFWKQLPKNTYTFSCKYYIPSNVVPGEWWNIMQWKSTNDKITDNSWPIMCVDVDKKGYIRVFYKPVYNDHNVKPYTTNILLPRDKWCTLSAEYKKDPKNGYIKLYLDGKLILSTGDIVTVLSDNTLYWSVNNYAQKILPNPCDILVSDIQITEV